MTELIALRKAYAEAIEEENRVIAASARILAARKLQEEKDAIATATAQNEKAIANAKADAKADAAEAKRVAELKRQQNALSQRKAENATCAKITKKGSRCKNPSANGRTRCQMHINLEAKKNA